MKYSQGYDMTENGKKIQRHLEKLQDEISLGLETPLKSGMKKIDLLINDSGIVQGMIYLKNFI